MPLAVALIMGLRTIGKVKSRLCVLLFKKKQAVKGIAPPTAHFYLPTSYFFKFGFAFSQSPSGGRMPMSMTSSRSLQRCS